MTNSEVGHAFEKSLSEKRRLVTDLTELSVGDVLSALSKEPPFARLYWFQQQSPQVRTRANANKLQADLSAAVQLQIKKDLARLRSEASAAAQHVYGYHLPRAKFGTPFDEEGFKQRHKEATARLVEALPDVDPAIVMHAFSGAMQDYR